jgi:hypothetical protein
MTYIDTNVLRSPKDGRRMASAVIAMMPAHFKSSQQQQELSTLEGLTNRSQAKSEERKNQPQTATARCSESTT